MDERMVKLWEKIGEMPGGDRDPFEDHLGPTEECLTTKEVVSYVKDSLTTHKTINHLRNCKVCSERVERFKRVI